MRWLESWNISETVCSYEIASIGGPLVSNTEEWKTRPPGMLQVSCEPYFRALTSSLLNSLNIM